MKSILIIGFVWPEPKSTAAGSRMIQLIEVFQKENFKVIFVSTASKNENSFDFNSINVETDEIELNNSNFDRYIKQLNPTIVLFDRYLTEEQFGWRVSENCPNSMRILDTEDLHFLRNARHKAFKSNSKVTRSLLINDIAKREIASIYRCDLTLIISKYELKLLEKDFKIDTSLLIYVPFLLEKQKTNTLKNYPVFENRGHFMTIGNFKHEPNWNSILCLKSEIWPIIRKKLPQAEMHIFGSYSSQKVQELHNSKEGFLIKGRIENSKDAFINSRVCLAPLQFGAGLKGKLIESMQFGTPSVTTNIGAEAMHKNLPWNGFIENSPEKFALKAIELYENQEVWEQAQKNGVKILNTCFAKEKYGNNLIMKIQKTMKNLNSHRLNNFIGEMFIHHTLKSTKYLSKWIEEKNRD